MAETEPEDYLEGRLKEQLDYHSTQSKKNKKRFYALQFVIIITSALIPIVNVTIIPGGDLLRLTSSILGGIIVVITAVMQLHKYQENWILFRTTQELLKKEKFLYLNDAGDYAGLDPTEKKRLLVERVESLVSSESSKYFATHKPEQGKQGENAGNAGSITTPPKQ